MLAGRCQVAPESCRLIIGKMLSASCQVVVMLSASCQVAVGKCCLQAVNLLPGKMSTCCRKDAICKLSSSASCRVAIKLSDCYRKAATCKLLSEGVFCRLSACYLKDVNLLSEDAIRKLSGCYRRMLYAGCQVAVRKCCMQVAVGRCFLQVVSCYRNVVCYRKRCRL